MRNLREYWDWIWDSESWMPRECCGPFEPWLKYLHVWSDKILSWEFQCVIPVALIALWLIFRKRARYAWFLLVFAAFIHACGLGHEIDSWAFKHPTYRLWGIVKGVTALLGTVASVSLVFFFPRLRKLKTAEEYERQCVETVAKQTDELQHALSLTNLVLDNAAAGMFLLDNHCKITYVNPKAVGILGWSQEEFLNAANLHDLVHYKHADGTPFPMHDCPLGKCYTEKIPLENHRDVFWHKDGHPVDVFCNMTPVFKDGAMVGAVLSVRDITQIKKSQEALAETMDRLRVSESTFRQLWEANIIGIGISEPNGRWLDANDKLLDMTGFSRDDMISGVMNWKTMTPEEYREVDATHVALADARGATDPYEKEYICKDGHRITVQIGYARLEGTEDRYICMIQNLTDQKKYLRELKHQESQLRLYIEYAPAAMAVFDKDMNYLVASRRWVLDYIKQQVADAPADLTGRNHYEVFKGDVPARWKEAHQKGLSGEIVTADEDRYDRQDGSKQWVRWEVRPWYDADGEVGGIIIFAEDVSDQKRHNEQLVVAMEKAEAANEAKSQFLAVLSHEMRTPLTPCLLSASSRAMDPNVPDELRRDFAKIQRLLELEARLIDDLLDVMLIVRGKMSFHMRVIDAHHKIELAADICRPDIVDKQIELILDLSADQHHVSADAARFQQVVWNLIKNAVKFTPKGGQVRVSTRNDGNDFILEVNDNGIGIKVDVLPTIFDAFIQGERNKGRKYGGLGLGLAISRAIVEGHGGIITVGSLGENQGSQFAVRLPVTFIPKLPPPQYEEPPKNSEGFKVFYVEDDKATRDVMTMLLKIHGHEVTSASSLTEALEIDPNLFDVLVSDIGLGDGTGLELMSKIRHRGCDLPGIAVSGFSTEEDMHESISVGFAEHLAKPLDFPKLDAAMRRHARQRVK